MDGEHTVPSSDAAGRAGSEPLVIPGYVPVIDLSSARGGTPEDRQTIADLIDEALRTSGFVVVTGHGVPRERVEAMYTVTREFFLLPEEVKTRWESPPGEATRRGLSRNQYVAASRGEPTPPDLCEFFTMNRYGEPGLARRDVLGDQYEALSRPNIWPDEPPGLKETWLSYFAEMEALSADLMRLFALALDLDESYFDRFIDDHYTYMIANYYPAQEAPPEPRQLRRGAHSDWGTLTVLYQDASPGGLQVLDKQGKWIDVPPVDDSFVINIGDLMAVWTNDRWVSTVHRVVNPPREAAGSDRVSLPFFHQPNFDAWIECLPSCTDEGNPPRHAPVTSGGWVEEMIRRSSAL
jgi:isopenicillin N synthase-like dioxygenase